MKQMQINPISSKQKQAPPIIVLLVSNQITKGSNNYTKTLYITK